MDIHDDSYIGDWIDEPEKLQDMTADQIVQEVAVIGQCPEDFDFGFEIALAVARGYLVMSEGKLLSLVIDLS